MKFIQELIDRIAQQRKPIFDKDDDSFSTYSALRGSNWRGKDCDDEKKDVYPGRSSTTHNVL
jgi:hypothetical protein